MIQNKDLEIYTKTTKAYELIFKKNGVAENITGWTIYFTCKLNMKDTDANAVIAKDITDPNHSDPTNGKTLIELTTSDTDLLGSYHYDIKFKDDNGNADILFRGRITFVKPVTMRG